MTIVSEAGAMVPANWLDRTIGFFAPNAALDRLKARRAHALLTGYDAAEATRKRKFHRIDKSGDVLARFAAMPLRNQARHLDRNHDVSHGALDKLTDFIVGPQGINVESAPKKRDGSIHQDYAQALSRSWAKFCEWPEVTWTHDWGAACRLVARTWLRDGEGLGQIISGPRNDQPYSMDVPLAIELLEPDLLPQFYDDPSQNIRQGIQRNTWGRPTAYYFYLTHPADDYSFPIGVGTSLPFAFTTKRVPAENVLHVRNVDRLHQLRGVSIFAPCLTTLQDIFEYRDSERLAAKMASSWVINFQTGTPDMAGESPAAWDPKNPPLYQMEGGMMVMTNAGQKAEFFDTSRPNVGAFPFLQSEMRHAAAGFGLSYSSLSRNYNGTYSAQRQELVENQPRYQAGTMVMVAQFARPIYQQFATWFALTHGMPRDVDPETLTDADYFGPPMIWIDPEKEANAQLMLVQARFRSSSQVIRQLGGRLRDTYTQCAHEQELRHQLDLSSTVDAPTRAVPLVESPAAPAAPAGDNNGDGGADSTTSTSARRVVPIRKSDSRSDA